MTLPSWEILAWSCAFFGGVASCVLREVAITRLHRNGRFAEAGAPRRLFYSDLLPIRLLMLGWRFSKSDRVLFKAYFTVWAVSSLAVFGYMFWFLFLR